MLLRVFINRMLHGIRKKPDNVGELRWKTLLEGWDNGKIPREYNPVVEDIRIINSGYFDYC